MCWLLNQAPSPIPWQQRRLLRFLGSSGATVAVSEAIGILDDGSPGAVKVSRTKAGPRRRIPRRRRLPPQGFGARTVAGAVREEVAGVGERTLKKDEEPRNDGVRQRRRRLGFGMDRTP
jgi:hypothetical protein